MMGTYEQRCQISARKKSDYDQRAIADIVGTTQSTVSRELARNTGARGYRHQQAQAMSEKCAPLWQFEQLGTLRRKLIQRAGRLTRPKRKLTLTMSANQAVKSELLHYLDSLKRIA